MNVVVFLALVVGASTGLLMVVAGLAGRKLFNVPNPRAAIARSGRTLARLGVVAAAGLFVFGITGWPIGAVLGCVVAWALPGIIGGKAEREDAIARTEAVASWTEMIRDSIVAASGLEEAIIATAPVAPPAIAAEVRTMVRRLDHQRLPDALTALGNDLEHPSADLVVAALVIASRMEASDLSSLLSRLADATRGEARMRIRVEVGRTRVRTATKVIVGVVVLAVLFLAVANRDYLEVYDSYGGQIMLGVIGGVFALGAWLLTRMASIELPERFTARSVAPGGHG